MLKHKLLTLFVALCATTALWASNTITYTATEKLTRSTLNVGATTFGSAIISHEFANGIGTITCGGDITTIGGSAFYKCTGLTSITIPDSVTTIGVGAFASCANLVSITIPYSVTTIEEGTFDSCSKLATITIPNSVTTIGNMAFYKCVGLNTITIPYSVTTIGTSAFAYCDGLPSFDVDTANTHYVSVDGVLFNYTKDTLIQYPIANLRSEYVIPDSVTTIGNRAFVHSSSLFSITIPQSVTTIEDMAFYYCDNLLSITIPKSVTTIGKSAFAWCDTLPFINVDAANTHYVSVEGVLFNYTKDTLIQYPIANLRTTYTIPNSVTAISDRAFARCKNLTSLTCEVTTPPTCGYNCFYDVDKSIPLYVPAGSVDAYKAADEWKDFTNIRPITAKDVEVTEIEAEPTESAVEIAWPSVVNAETYTIEIRLNDKLICSIVFNAQGQLVSINFNLAPDRGGHTYATTAESTATGWAYTIAGLNPGTNYTYSVIAKDASEQVIDTKSGSFTTHGMPMDIEIVNAGVNTTKSLRNGQVIIRQGDKTYNVVGQEL